MMKARRVVIKPEPGIKPSAEKDYEFRFVPDYIWKGQAKKPDPEGMKKFIDQGFFVYDERNGDHRIYTIGSF